MYRAPTYGKGEEGESNRQAQEKRLDCLLDAEMLWRCGRERRTWGDGGPTSGMSMSCGGFLFA